MQDPLRHQPVACESPPGTDDGTPRRIKKAHMATMRTTPPPPARGPGDVERKATTVRRSQPQGYNSIGEAKSTAWPRQQQQQNCSRGDDDDGAIARMVAILSASPVNTDKICANLQHYHNGYGVAAGTENQPRTFTRKNHSIKRKAELLEGKIWQNLEQSTWLFSGLMVACMDTSERLDLHIGIRLEAHWIQQLHHKLLIVLAWASQEDELARSLEDCLSVFQSGLLHDIHIEGLVFWEPSKEDDLRPPPPLQRLAKANTQFLEYCEWIKKMFINCQNLDCGTFEHCRSIRDQLLHDIQNEWIKLDNLQLHAWQMVSQKDHSVPTQSDPGPTVNNFGLALMQVIDTSPYFEMSPLSSDVQPVVVVAYILVAVMHIVSGLSLRDCGQLLFTIQFLINLMVEDFHTTNSQGKYLAKSVPSDACTVIWRLALQPSYRVFVCCPNRQYHTPVCHYFYHTFNNWLGQMLCHPGVEDMMDHDTSLLSGGVMEDIWDVPGLYEIPGADGHPFICKYFWQLAHGKIKQIFTIPFWPSSEAYFIVQRFKELSAQEAQQDPYCPLVGGHLYHPGLEGKIEVVVAQEVIAHFACTPYDRQAFGIPCFHMLP
ncbi:hypothetical protein EDB84DRAFT_1446219 [Lactarius hengduanensis]|nr:hypothetical protein EDB84DRAFT_1446219 [Lactarius hengduanensis]